jgi:hypothetical protein
VCTVLSYTPRFTLPMLPGLFIHGASCRYAYEPQHHFIIRHLTPKSNTERPQHLAGPVLNDVDRIVTHRRRMISKIAEIISKQAAAIHWVHRCSVSIDYSLLTVHVSDDRRWPFSFSSRTSRPTAFAKLNRALHLHWFRRLLLEHKFIAVISNAPGCRRNSFHHIKPPFFIATDGRREIYTRYPM